METNKEVKQRKEKLVVSDHSLKDTDGPVTQWKASTASTVDRAPPVSTLRPKAKCPDELCNVCWYTQVSCYSPLDELMCRGSLTSDK